MGAGQDKASDLVLCALVRARFGELLAPLTAHGESDLFLLGPLSMLDLMLETPMSAILKKIPLDSETKAVLRGEPSLLRPLYQFMLAQASGEWEAARDLRDSHGCRYRRGLLVGRPDSGPAKSPAVRKKPALELSEREPEQFLPSNPSALGGPNAKAAAAASGHVLLCKTGLVCHLRGCRETSTISLFLLASFPRRPSASQAVPGGATDPTTDNRYFIILLANTILFHQRVVDHDCVRR